MTKCCYNNIYKEIGKDTSKCVNCGNIVSKQLMDTHDNNYYNPKVYYGKTKNIYGNNNLDLIDEFYDGYGYWDYCMYLKDHKE